MINIYKKYITNIYINNNNIIITLLYYNNNINNINYIRKNNINKNLFIKYNYFINYKNKNTINEINIKQIKIINKINIISLCKGKGFCGTIKKHKFKSNKSTHGNSKAHNKPGSIGMCQTPGRIMKGKKMAGHLGNNKKQIKNIEIIFIKKNIICIKGIIPGNNNQIININEIK